MNDGLALLVGLLQGQLAQQELEKRQQLQKAEAEKENIIRQMRLSELLHQQKMDEERLLMQQEQLRMAQEAHNLSQSINRLDYNYKAQQLIAQRALEGMQQNKPPEQIAQEVSAIVGRTVTPDEVLSSINLTPVYAAIDEMVKDFQMPSVSDVHVNQYMRLVRQRFGNAIADNPSVNEYLRGALQRRAIEISSAIQTRTAMVGAETKIRTAAEKELIREKGKVESALQQQRFQNEVKLLGVRRAMVGAAQREQQLDVFRAVATDPLGFVSNVPAPRLDERTVLTAAPDKISNAYRQYFNDVYRQLKSAKVDLQSLKSRYASAKGSDKLLSASAYYGVRFGLAYNFLRTNLEHFATSGASLGNPTDRRTAGFRFLDMISAPVKEVFRSLATDVDNGVLTQDEAVNILRQTGIAELPIYYTYDNKEGAVLPFTGIQHTGLDMFFIYRDILRYEKQQRQKQSNQKPKPSAPQSTSAQTLGIAPQRWK